MTEQRTPGGADRKVRARNGTDTGNDDPSVSTDAGALPWQPDATDTGPFGSPTPPASQPVYAGHGRDEVLARLADMAGQDVPAPRRTA